MTVSPMRPTEWSLLLFLSMLWGFSFFFTELALREVPPITIVFARVFTASILLSGVLFFSGQRFPRGFGTWCGLALMALLNSLIPVSLIAWAQTTISSSLSAIIAASSPLMGAVAAHVFTTDDKLSARRLIGTVTGFFGVVIVIGPSGVVQVGQDILPQMAVLVAAASSACASVFGRRFSQKGTTSLAAATGQVSISAAIAFPLMMFLERPWTLEVSSISTVWALGGLGVLSTALAYLIFFHLLASAGATNTQLTGFLVPATATFLGTLVLNETLLRHQLFGMLVLLAGLIIIDGRLFRNSPRRCS